ncbi:PAS domain S-box protein [Methanoregula formicica]|uniref:histidine kinase n=1 Tax=Methanoregula formicica (strain DSM 22288 / NBRC 105244 / SMSP) TaxID=593750 RepID=L0HD97_METFS|nr:PAS domain S-box protein [Methanoregula formicica]AGB02000.1 PAS domain S-box [Methanoregula formicica SMSP]
MAEGLRVLYVDDEPELLEMAKIFLEMNGEFQVGISTSAKEVISLPLTRSYDAIVSDYEMPVMNGIAFLKHVREQFGDIPFILFTGRGREEVVIDAINNGADFYLQKGGSAQAQFAELAHKIRQAVVKRRAQAELQEAYNRITASEEELARSEQQLQESEGKFRDFADHLPQIVFETDMDLRITYVNKYTVASYGFPAEVVGSGLSILTFIHPSQHATFMVNVHHLRYGIPFEPREYTAFNKDGTPFPVIVYSSPIFRNKQMVGFRGVVADISARKQAEAALRESEEKHRTFAELLPQIVFETDCSLVLSFVNNQALTQLGYTPQEVASGFNALTIIDPSQHDRLRKNIVSFMRGEPYTHEEYTLIRKNGTTFPGLIYADVVYRNGQMAGFRGIIIDISEQKQAEQALRESEQKYRTLVEVIQDIVYYLDPQGTIVYISPQVMDQLGYHPDEILGKNFSEFIHQDDARVLTSHIRTSRPIGTPLPQDQFRVRRNDGTYRWYEDKSIRILNATGEQVTIGTIRDITEKKIAEEAVFQSQQMLQTVLDTIPQRVFWKDRSSVFLGCNKPLAQDVGYSDPADMIGKTDYDHSSAATAEHFQEDDREVMETGQPKIHFEEQQIRPNGSTSWLRTSKVPLRNREGEIIGVLGTYEDITEQKKAHEALLESEARFRDLTDRLPQMVFETDRELRITYANRHAASVTGFSVKELTEGKPVLSLIKPAQHARFMESVKSILANIPYEPKEYTAIRKDGSTFPVVVYSSLVYRNQEIIGFRGVAIDISGLRKMEEGIRESEEKFRSLVENASDIVFSLDPAGNFTYVSPQWSEILGHDTRGLIGSPSAALIHPDDLPGNVRAFHSVMEKGTRVHGIEYRVLHRDGTWRWHSQSAAPLRNASGEIISYMGICRDITDQRTAEEALHESEVRLRLLTDNVKDVIWTADMDMHLTYVTPSVHELRGMMPEEAIGEPVEEALTPESLAIIREHYRHATSDLQEGKIMPAPRPLELEFRRKDGSTVWTEVIITPMLGTGGIPTGVIGLTRDISQRRASETALRESEKMFSTIFRTSLVALTLLSVKDNTFYAVNDAFIKNSGYSREEVLGKTPWEIGLLVDREIGERIATVLKKERHIEAEEVPFRAKDGTVRVCLYSATLITMQEELYLLSSVIDISGRKNMEEALRQANHKLNILSGITRHDINNQLQALGGYVELLRRKVPETAHADDFSRISRTIEQISNLIQFTKEYEMIGVHEPAWQNLHGLVAAAEKAALPKAIRCENLLPGDLDIFADPLISKVFFNLLDNAKRHGGSIQQVRFTLEENDGARIVVCSDDGVGVPPADKERIFAPGVGKNTGFGLAISREILDITGITIRETGTNGNGARFEITVPAGKHRMGVSQ